MNYALTVLISTAMCFCGTITISNLQKGSTWAASLTGAITGMELGLLLGQLCGVGT